MAANQLFVQVVKRSEDEFIVNRISTDKRVWYLLPEELQELKHHPFLTSKKIIMNATAVIKNIGGFRTIALRIDEDIRKEYFDESDNICFQEFPLEEFVPIPVPRAIEPKNIELENRIKQLEHKLKEKSINDDSFLRDIETKFILNRFKKGQYDSELWLRQFEDECHRFKVILDNHKVQALRYFVDGPARDWYESNLKKIGLNTSWEVWKDSFLNVFVDKGWSIVRKAFNFKYLGGSIVDYALAKEKLCLEMEPKSTEISRVNQIVFGLPIEAQDRLDREEITTIDKLFSKLRRLEDTFIRQQKGIATNCKPIGIQNPQRKLESQQKNESQRKPCPNCVAQGFPNRYHLLSECRNKNGKDHSSRSNMIKNSTSKNECEVLNLDNDDLN